MVIKNDINLKRNKENYIRNNNSIETITLLVYDVKLKKNKKKSTCI